MLPTNCDSGITATILVKLEWVKPVFWERGIASHGAAFIKESMKAYANTLLAKVHLAFCFKPPGDKETTEMRHTGYVLVLTGLISRHINPACSSDSLNFMLSE